MYGYVDYGECKNNDLYTGDIAGIKAIYGTCAGIAARGPEERIVPEAAGTTVKFAVPKAGPATVQVYNVMGQMIATLADGNLEAGEQSLAWNGRDSNGNAAASGVYFVMVRGADYTASSKLMLVK
jgi:flagellar hook assembly protein FlgD